MASSDTGNITEVKAVYPLARIPSKKTHLFAAFAHVNPITLFFLFTCMCLFFASEARDQFALAIDASDSTSGTGTGGVSTATGGAATDTGGAGIGGAGGDATATGGAATATGGAGTEGETTPRSGPALGSGPAP